MGLKCHCGSDDVDVTDDGNYWFVRTSLLPSTRTYLTILPSTSMECGDEVESGAEGKEGYKVGVITEIEKAPKGDKLNKLKVFRSIQFLWIMFGSLAALSVWGLSRCCCRLMLAGKSLSLW